MATHTLTDEEYRGILNDRDVAWRRIGELEELLKQAKLDDPANRVKPLNELARAMLVIVRFGVANLPPMTTRSWPVVALRKVADLLPVLADVTDDDGTLATELHAFASECESYAVERERERREKINADSQQEGTL